MDPLLGLLDTISGMITSFSVFNTEPGQAAAITGGVGEALLRRYSGSVWSIAYFHIISDMELCFSVLEFRCDSKKEMWTLAYNQGPIFVNSSFFYDIVF